MVNYVKLAKTHQKILTVNDCKQNENKANNLN